MYLAVNLPRHIASLGGVLLLTASLTIIQTVSFVLEVDHQVPSITGKTLVRSTTVQIIRPN